MSSFYVPKNIDEAYCLAAEAKPELDAFATTLSEKFGCDFTPAPLKGRERAEQKLHTKYKDDMSKLNDLARCRLICDSLEQIDAIKTEVKKNKRPEREVDRMDQPNERGYRDLKFAFAAKNGLLVEMQIQLRDFANADKETHRHYEKIRAITADAKSRPLTEREQKEIVVREKLCQRIYRNAALNYNAHTTGRKLKMQENAPSPLLMKQERNGR